MTEKEENRMSLPVTQETCAAWVACRYIADPEFRAGFDRDPKAMLEKVSGRKAPEGVEIRVHRNDEKCWHISLPSGEVLSAMTDKDAEVVSGGVTIMPYDWK